MTVAKTGGAAEPVEETLREIRREIEAPPETPPGGDADPDGDVLVLTDVVEPGTPGADAAALAGDVARRAEEAVRTWAETHLPRMVREAVGRELGARGGRDRS